MNSQSFYFPAVAKEPLETEKNESQKELIILQALFIYLLKHLFQEEKKSALNGSSHYFDHYKNNWLELARRCFQKVVGFIMSMALEVKGTLSDYYRLEPAVTNPPWRWSAKEEPINDRRTIDQKVSGG